MVIQKAAQASINVTSGLAFTPAMIAPVFSATKAALHSSTMSLRHQLSDTSVEVIEVAPPAVNTDLGGATLHTFGEPFDAFADGIFKGLEAGKKEMGYGTSVNALRMSRDEIDKWVEKGYQLSKNMIELLLAKFQEIILIKSIHPKTKKLGKITRVI